MASRISLCALCAFACLGLSSGAAAQQPWPPPPQPQPAPQPYPPQAQPQPAPYPPQPAPYPQPQPQPQPYPPQGQPYPPQGQPYPPQGQPYPPQGQPYPPQPQPYPPQGQPYPPQGQPYPPQGYPPQGQPYPPQGQPYPPQPYPGQQPPPAPAADQKRGASEMTFLYITSVGYGVGSGIWIDALAKVTDPGFAFITPVVLGAAMPIGVYFWDDNATIHRGVPSSISTGLMLGAAEGMAISGVQWQYTGNGGPDTWSFKTQTSITWIMSSAGGLGGYAFGEWLRPDPRSLAFIASGSAWGAVSGTLFGAGIVNGDWKDGAAIWGLVGYNAGIVATGALSTVYTPSYNATKWMWIGYAGGTAAGFLIYPFYLFSDAPVRHGLVANALGGLAGIAVAAAFTAQMSDNEPTKPRGAYYVPPFNVGFAPTPGGGAALSAYGAW